MCNIPSEFRIPISPYIPEKVYEDTRAVYTTCAKKKKQKAGNLDHIFDSKESTACLPDFELSLFLGKTSVSFFFFLFFMLL